MRLLLTGGAGFVGSHLADRLVREGHQVAVLDDLSSGRREQVPEGARFYELDLRSPWLGRVLSRERPEVVFHLAAQIDVRRSVADPGHDAEINVLGTVRLLQASAANRVRRLVFMSSGGAIYGDTEEIPTREDHPQRPSSPYGASKAAGEAYLSAFQDSFGLETAALRPGNIYGPRQDPRGEAGVVAIFAGRMLGGEVATINGDGLQTRDYVYVEDVVDAAIRLLDGPLGHYNVGTARETSVVDLAAALGRVVSARGIAVPAPIHGPAKSGEQRRSCLDCGLVRGQLQWAPTVDLEEGLRRTVEYFAARI